MSFTIRAMAAEDIDPLLLLAGDSVDAPQWTRRDYQQILLATPSGLLRRYGLVALSGAQPDRFCRCQLVAAGRR